MDFTEIPANEKSIDQRSLICGVGINDADYQVYPTINGKQMMCPYYRTWKSMLERCYSKKHQERWPTYIGCTVCKEWLVFSVFKEWMEKQDWEGKQLDKDIINPKNKIYSPDTCVFVTSQINNLLNNRKAKRGEYPQGVSLNKQSGYFYARCNVNGKVKRLGQYDTPEEASGAYKKFKSELIINIANEQTDIRIKNGLIKHAKTIMGKT